MKRTFGTLLASLFALTGVRADFDPVAWHSSPLDVAAGNTNEWYFFPDDANNPRVLVKSTGAQGNSSSSHRLLNGGPPDWTADVAETMALSKQGAFVKVPGFGGGAFLVAPHNTLLKMAIFDSGGSATIETIVNVQGIYTGISAELDSNGKLHVGFVNGANADTLCYARRNGANSWTVASQLLPNNTIHETAVVPISFTDTRLFYTSTSPYPNFGNVRSLLIATPKVNPADSNLYITWAANLIKLIEPFVDEPLKGSRVGSVGRVYYFDRPDPVSVGGTQGTARRLMRYIGTGLGNDPGAEASELENAGAVVPKSIHVATGTDNKQRVVWYDETNKRVHYLKTGGADIPVLGGYPVVTTGNQANADVLGLHFNAAGMPFILYRTTAATAFVAFPNDNFDFDGNGRLDIMDNAFNSTTAGLEVLPVKAAVAGVTNSADRFKFRFPTVGSAATNSSSAVTTSQRNFRYGFELSTNGTTWTPMTSSNGIVFTQTAATGTNPNQVRTMVGVVTGAAPGSLPKRFARMVVTRPTYPY